MACGALRPRSVLPLAAAVLALVGIGCAQPARDDAARPEGDRLSVAALLGEGDETGFARALEPRRFRFPIDHGPHPDFRTEWWYLTGNLRTPAGRRFGYQLTFFRSALVAEAAPRSSAWASRQSWMAHFAVADVEERRFHAFERFSRGGLALAGAEAEPLAVWLEDWRLWRDARGDGFRLRAAQEDVALELALEHGKGPILQGDDGLSRKGSRPGNASYYYSLPRMPSAGELRLGGARFEVAGASWMDREWSTSVLEQGQVGWDWFALQLSDGRELMYYQLRRRDGSPDPLSSGSLIAADAGVARLSPDDVRIDIRDRWQSDDGVSYPIAWRLRLPAEELELEIRALLPDQEHRSTFRYWEGAVEASGRAAGEAVDAVGYAELTGYAPANG